MKECTICYKRRQKFTELQCGHEFCVVCWDKWEAKQLDYYQRRYPTCPVCRQEQRPQTTEWYVRLLFIAFLIWMMQGSPTLAKIPQTV